MYTHEKIKRILDEKLESQLKVIEKHRRLWNNETGAEPLAIVLKTAHHQIPRDIMFDNPEKNLEAKLAWLAYSLEIGDDCVPAVRIGLGTALMASVFGTQIITKAEGPAYAAHEPVVNCPDDLKSITELDPVKTGKLGLWYKHASYFRTHLPNNVRIWQADLQGPWNTAHLIRGDKLFTDVIDDPDFVKVILSHVSDAMLKTVTPMKEFITETKNEICYNGTIAKGASRIANCSTDMISAGMYNDLILEVDKKYFDTVGGGWMHICGNNAHCIEHFNKIENLFGLEFNFNYLDLFKISQMVRKDMVLFCTGPVDPPLQTPLGKETLDKLFRGVFPEKKNIIYVFNDPSTDEYAKILIQAVRMSRS